MSVNVEALVAKVPTGLLIGSSWRPSSSDEVFDVINPATEEKLAAVSSATSEDAVAALDAACAVQQQWAATSPRERAEILRRAYELVIARADDFATFNDP